MSTSSVAVRIYSITLGDGWHSAVGGIKAEGVCVRVAVHRRVAEPHEAVMVHR